MRKGASIADWHALFAHANQSFFDFMSNVELELIDFNRLDSY